ncbi:MAG TPA: S1 family peptidase, partial [Mycobacterium sp.]|nr:S1 family peptidase [Mycobacterium sp.]
MAAAAALVAGPALANPTPGMEVRDENSSCTAGFAAQRGIGQYYLLTSGHCDGQDFLPWTDAGDTPIGRIVASENNGDDRDAAMIELNPSAGVPNGDVDGRYRIRDVLTADQITVGMPFCKVGARTGETCGTITAVNGNLVTTNLFSLEGDSGSPGFVTNPDGTVSAVGILQGGPDGDDNTT